ncbi:MAG: hypothetical protein JWM11_91 [Planctomycetaceae bacterium]|nr:hypothetical protein [Planctomycetaceae bacterium]
MISFPSVTKSNIRFHYDLSTLFYRLMWGRHIHHGLWVGKESTHVAQQRLTETLASLAGVHPGNVILDVGCGMGGSTMHLARNGCEVTGVTLSPIQKRWAAGESWVRGLSRRTHWMCADAETLECPPSTFDVVWSIECTEHLFDKPAFFRRAAQWLKPGGRMAICAWLAGDRTDAAAVQKVVDVCEGFLCPSLGTSADYRKWFTDAGLVVEQDLDWTAQVQQTWEICHRRVRRWGIRHLARLIDRDTVRFLDRFPTILEAYQDGSMKYGCFIAKRPDEVK